MRLRARELVPTGILILTIAAVYCAAGYVGMLQQVRDGEVSLLWPTPGIALAALFLFGQRVWPAISIGSFLISVLAMDHGWGVSLGVAAGTTIGVLCAYMLLRRVGFRVELDRLRDLVALVVFGALLGTVIAAVIGVGALSMADTVIPSNFWSRWLLQSLSAAMGVLIITPLLLVLRTARWPRGVRLVRTLEAVVLVGATVAVMLITTRTSTELLFLVFPLLIWAALRFQLAGAAPLALIVSTMAVYGAINGSGPFEGQDVYSNLITIQAFNASTTLTALVLAVTTTERNQAHDEVEEAATQLASVVNQLDRSLRPRSVTLAQGVRGAAVAERRVVRERIEGANGPSGPN
ncbi:MASE1 domain-containing protein [Actinopolymorpha pittospori]